MSETTETAAVPVPLPAGKTVTDSDGRTLLIRELDMLEEFDLIETAGPDNSANQRWMQYATIVSCVRSIDGMPSMALRGKKALLRDWVKRVGPAGYAAVVKALGLLKVDDAGDETPSADPLATAKNSAGTPA